MKQLTVTKSLILTLVAAIAAPALADGFVCRAHKELLTIQVYNITSGPETRTAEVMVVSDSQVGPGRKTIARFSRDQSRLVNRGSHYLTTVDLRFKDTSRADELIAGTKLGELARLELKIDFSYARPVPEGEELEGLMTLTKRNRALIELEMDCLRYLKGE